MGTICQGTIPLWGGAKWRSLDISQIVIGHRFGHQSGLDESSRRNTNFVPIWYIGLDSERRWHSKLNLNFAMSTFPTFGDVLVSSFYFWEIVPFFELCVQYCFRRNPTTKRCVLTLGSFQVFGEISQMPMNQQSDLAFLRFPSFLFSLYILLIYLILSYITPFAQHLHSICSAFALFFPVNKKGVTLFCRPLPIPKT